MYNFKPMGAYCYKQSKKRLVYNTLQKFIDAFFFYHNYISYFISWKYLIIGVLSFKIKIMSKKLLFLIVITYNNNGFSQDDERRLFLGVCSLYECCLYLWKRELTPPLRATNYKWPKGILINVSLVISLVFTAVNYNIRSGYDTEEIWQIIA